MLNKKGFTLIEILAVIVILSIIAVIATTTVTRLINKTSNNIFTTNENSLEPAAESYYNENLTLLPKFIGGQTKVLLTDLISNGYIKKIKNPADKAVYCDGYVVTTKIGEDKYTYDSYLKCGSDYQTTNYVVGGPTLVDTESTICASKECLQEIATIPTTYSGATPSNYVWYSGKLWRIIKVYTDEDNQTKIKMITQDPIAMLGYGPNNNFDTSYVKKWLNENFYNSLNKKEYILTSNFCVGNETNECSIKSSNKVGLLTYNEFKNGATTPSSYTTNNYLYINSTQWLMTPYSLSSTWTNKVSGLGVSISAFGSPVYYAVRPVVNLVGTAILDKTNYPSMNGTSANPYRIEGDSKASANTKLNSRYAGEYVSYGGYTWRIVEAKGGDNNTKLIMTSTISQPFDSSPTDGLFNPSKSTNIGYYLNNTFYNSLTNKTWIEDSTWYRGTHNIDYRLLKTNPITAKVGLILPGEMFSSNDITLTNSSWDMRAGTTTDNYVISTSGNSTTLTSTTSGNVRPVISLTSTITITSGEGTSASPYVITKP
jgi:prepilin-type N-terminal cleavage/methylation domain-containing protein